jgi:hypothetical protein
MKEKINIHEELDNFLITEIAKTSKDVHYTIKEYFVEWIMLKYGCVFSEYKREEITETALMLYFC